MHFYHLSALDWVDVVVGAEGGSGEGGGARRELSAVDGQLEARARRRCRTKVEGFVDGGQLGIFTNGYWGHPAMKLPPEVNLLAVAHYLQALEYQRKANQVVAILGGKTPNIQNLAVGGVANAINLDNPATLNMEQLYQVKDAPRRGRRPSSSRSTSPTSAPSRRCTRTGSAYGAGVTNYLSVPDLPLDAKRHAVRLARRHRSWNGDLGERAGRSRARTTTYLQRERHRVDRARLVRGRLAARIRGRARPSRSTRAIGSDDGRKYSWVKAPRFEGKPMQVGPLAQVLVGYALGHEPIVTKWANWCLEHGRRRSPAMKLGPGGPALDARPPRRPRDPRRA